MKCQSCGSETKIGSTFCSSCGAPIQKNEQVQVQAVEQGPVQNNQVPFNNNNQMPNYPNNQYNPNFYGQYPNKKGNGLKIFIIILVLLAILGTGGYFGYKYLIEKKGDDTKEKDKDKKKDEDKSKDDDSKPDSSDEEEKVTSRYITIDNYRIYLLKDYKEDDESTISKGLVTVTFEAGEFGSVQEVFFEKEEFIKTYQEEGLIIDRFEVKKMDNVEFLYIEVSSDDMSLTQLFIDIDKDKVMLVQLMDTNNFKKPDLSYINDVIIMMKSIQKNK